MGSLKEGGWGRFSGHRCISRLSLLVSESLVVMLGSAQALWVSAGMKAYVNFVGGKGGGGVPWAQSIYRLSLLMSGPLRWCCRVGRQCGVQPV